MNNAVMFSKASDEWATPYALFEALDAEFSFDIDVAATRANTKCPLYLTQADDALRVEWTSSTIDHPVCWMNPPYSQCRAFIAKAAEEARKGCTVVALVPSRTDTRWWHEHVWDRVTHAPQLGVQVRFLKGRLTFEGAPACAPFPSVVIVFRPAVAILGASPCDG